MWAGPEFEKRACGEDASVDASATARRLAERSTLEAPRNGKSQKQYNTREKLLLQSMQQAEAAADRAEASTVAVRAALRFVSLLDAPV